MKNILSLILILLTIKATGQNHLIGVKGGINWTNIKSNNFRSQINYRTTLTPGITYEYCINKNFSVGADFIYNQRGFYDDYNFTDEFGNPNGENYSVKYKYDYISLPLKAGFKFGTKFYGFTNIGIIPSLLVDAKTTMPNFNWDGSVEGNITYEVKSRVSKFDFAGFAEIGGGCKLNERSYLYASFLLQRSFTSITNSNYFEYSEIWHYGMSLNVGLKYSLTKK